MTEPPPPSPPLPVVLIVDDHPIVLYGLRFALEQQGRFVIGGEATNAEAARALAVSLQPAFIILDLVLGGRDGIELVRDLVGLAPDSRILVYSSQSEWRYARRVLAAGASGFVAKSDGLDVVANALEVVARGEIFVGEEVRRRLIEGFVEGSPTDTPDALSALSERELQVLRLIGDGRSTSEIATELQLSVKTIGTYRDRLKAKFAIDNARDLSVLARDRSWG